MYKVRVCALQVEEQRPWIFQLLILNDIFDIRFDKKCLIISIIN